MNFDVLSCQKISFPLLVEASAGTGKTFTIEHLVVRAILERSQDIKKACIITFTRACAKELSIRIRKAIENALEILEDPDGFKKAPDYLKVYHSDIHRLEAIKKLKGVLYDLSACTISTIHGFCLKMLKEFNGLENAYDALGFASKRDLFLIIKDFLAHKLSSFEISASEIYVLLEKYQYDFTELFEQIITSLWKENLCDLKYSKTVQNELFDKIAATGFTSDQVNEKLILLSQNYTGFYDKQGLLKPTFEKAFSSFADLFAYPKDEVKLCTFIRNGVLFSLLFAESARKKKSKDIDVEFLNVLFDLEKTFCLLVDPEKIFERLVKIIKPFVFERLEALHFVTHDELLARCSKLSEDLSFRKFLQHRFDFVVIDEFQDTDPLQWNIISKSFLDNLWQGSLYLVGDPKQAIYSFRGADVYSYIKAKKSLENIQCLNTNYRASKSLVDGLNALFQTNKSTMFFLPKINESLQIPKILTSNQTCSEIDEKGSIHFFLSANTKETSERSSFFPFIANEIKNLFNKGVALKDIAILVSDRFQSERLCAYLKEKKVPHTIWKKGHLTKSESFLFCQRIMECLFNPKSKKTIARLLINPPFLFSEEKLLEFQGECKAALHLWGLYAEQFLKMKKVYDRYGFCQSYQSLISNSLFKESIDQYKAIDPDFFWDMEQILFRISENEKSIAKSQNGISSFLQSMKEIAQDEDSAISRPGNDGVNILTTHRSKGLEFDFVFALGLMSKTKKEIDFLEKDAEKIRQFYVAVTRAKKRVYIPFERQEKAKEPGTSSPIELFLAHRFYCNQTKKTSVYECLDPCDLQAALDELCTFKEITKSEYVVEKGDEICIPCYESEKNFPIKKLALSYSERFTSFSHLKKQKGPTHDLFQNSEKKSFVCPYFPMGSIVGTFVHALLQSFLQNKELLHSKEKRKAWLTNKLKKSCLQAYEETISELFSKLLDIPFTTQTEQFYLKNVNLLNEVDFCYKEKNDFVRGAIDCVVETENGYYIIDWKTNALGVEKSAYERKNLEKVIEDSSYLLQAKIYGECLKRNALPFCGVFFVFLRGLFYSDEGDDLGIIYFPEGFL